MKFALVSDIHGNYKAFEEFLHFIEKQKPDGVICLGDYVTDSPYPEKTMALLYEMMDRYPCYMVRGNREQYLIDNFHNNKGWGPSSAKGALWYTSKHITLKDIAFFESLPSTKSLYLPNCPSAFLMHGSPDSLRGNMTADRKLKERSLAEAKEEYLLGGHSHRQESECLFGKTYINPGSLGMAIDGEGRHAQFTMLQTHKVGERIYFELEPVTISYDVDSYLHDFTVCGLDEYGMILNRAIKKTLVTGINYFYLAVVESIKASGLSLGDIPESVWEETARKLEI